MRKRVMKVDIRKEHEHLDDPFLSAKRVNDIQVPWGT
jgi:hypothetical protein